MMCQNIDSLNEKYETSCRKSQTCASLVVNCAAVVIKMLKVLVWLCFLSVYIFAALVPIVRRHDYDQVMAYETNFRLLKKHTHLQKLLKL